MLLLGNFNGEVYDDDNIVQGKPWYLDFSRFQGRPKFGIENYCSFGPALPLGICLGRLERDLRLGYDCKNGINFAISMLEKGPMMAAYYLSLQDGFYRQMIDEFDELREFDFYPDIEKDIMEASKRRASRIFRDVFCEVSDDDAKREVEEEARWEALLPKLDDEEEMSAVLLEGAPFVDS